MVSKFELKKVSPDVDMIEVVTPSITKLTTACEPTTNWIDLFLEILKVRQISFQMLMKSLVFYR